MKGKLFTVILSLIAAATTLSQGQPRPQGPPPHGDGPGHHGWVSGVDTDRNGSVDRDEFQAAVARTFADLDRNSNGIIESSEKPPPRPPRGERLGPPPGQALPYGMPGVPPAPAGPPNGARPLLPPFFFMEKFRSSETLSRTEFENAAKEVFAAMDADNDGTLSREESRPPGGDRGPIGVPPPPPPPNAMFIGAELRFGDRLVKDRPVSAETVIEDTRRLFDGTTVTKTARGAIYRDTSGRTRREQPLEMVGGFNIVNQNNKAQVLVFINDFAAGTQYFLDLNDRIARKQPIRPNGSLREEPDSKDDAKSESLGSKTLEGITVEGTRTTFEIPAGHIGNEKPMQVVTETWFSPELQLTVMSRHLDPLSGEHIFRLVNIKRSEPSPELFSVPKGFRIEN